MLAASQLLTARARQLRKAGIAGGMDELRVQAYLEKLGVLDPLAAIRQGPDSTPDDGAADGGGGNGGPGYSGPDDHGHSGPGGPGYSGPGDHRHSGPAGGARAVPGEVPAGFAARTNLTLPLATLLDLAERPGFMPGIGPIDPNPGANTPDRYQTGYQRTLVLRTSMYTSRWKITGQRLTCELECA